MKSLRINIATRSSKLALAQTNIFINKLSADKDFDFEICKQITSGDIRSMENKVQFDKANFVEDIEESLLSGKADIAVHSLKDMPAEQNSELEIIALIQHKYCNDLLIFPNKIERNMLPEMLIGTSSLRRRFQCKHFLNHKNVANINGNIDTRLKKLEQDEYQAIILAQAGIDRLNLKVNSAPLDENKFLPAIGQGSIAIQCRKNDKKVKDLCMNLSNKSDIDTIELERKIIRGLEADCNSAIGIKLIQHDAEQKLKVQVLSENEFIEINEINKTNNKEKFIDLCLTKLIKMGAMNLLHENY